MKSSKARIVYSTIVAATLLAAASCGESIAGRDAMAQDGAGPVTPIEFRTVECVIVESSVREIRMPPAADGSYTVARNEVVVYGHVWAGTPDLWLVQRRPQDPLSSTLNVCPGTTITGRTCTRDPAADASVLGTYSTETLRPQSNGAGDLFVSCGTVTHASLVRYDSVGTVLDESNAEPVEDRYEVRVGER